MTWSGHQETARELWGVYPMPNPRNPKSRSGRSAVAVGRSRSQRKERGERLDDRHLDTAFDDMQLFELFLHLTMPGGLGVQAEIAQGGFQIHSGVGLRLPSVCAERNRAVAV